MRSATKVDKQHSPFLTRAGKTPHEGNPIISPIKKYFNKGDNDRLAGWMQVHYRMAFDKDGYPMMYVFNTCKAFIRTIPVLMYDRNKLEDLDTKMEDHVADETRYFCMSRPITPQEEKESNVVLSDPLNQYKSVLRYR